MGSNRRQAPTSQRARPAARIAAERARRGKRAAATGGSAGGKRASTAPRGASATARTSRASRSGGRGALRAPGPRRFRVWAWVLAMSVLGFGTVYFGVGLQRVLRDGKLSDYNAEILLEKLIDRLLDRDVPRTEPAATPRAPRSRPPSRAVHQAPKPPRAPEPSPKSGLAPDPSGRAELTADAPERYARDSKSLHEARQRSRRAQDSRARIDAILRQVGVSSGDEP